MDGDAPIRVRIRGDHPWAGYTGIAIAVEKPSVGILPPMVRVRLDEGQDCPYQHECFADRSNLVILPTAKK